ncbi:MAG: site-2 protease family protein [Myxococcales bacterium]|nr:site-2 protease family protein [Myxococcales bacterium]MDD9970071.1 site-2 protease family protein [Myxococcales bacterium]
MKSASSAPSSHVCKGCGLEFPLSALACPRCQRLVHRERLQALSAEAKAAADAGQRERALTLWRDVLALLPDSSRQHAQVQARISSLTEAAGAQPEASPPARGAGNRALAGLGAVGLLLWKFKAVLAFVLTKGKILLLGLTKTSTLFSMLLSMGVYWTIWGWRFAVGLVLSIYIHEIGHVVALRRLGIAASAPMFIPGLGAVVRAHQYPSTEAEDAEVGLAGPLWGLGAALACWLAGVVWQAPFFTAMARVGAVINLFNLMPIWQLDGGRGFRALDRRQRWIASAVIGAAALLSGEGLLMLLLLIAVGRAVMDRGPEQPNRRAMVTYAGLVLALSWLTTLSVDAPREPMLALARVTLTGHVQP